MTKRDPYMDDRLLKWISSYARQNYWRVPNWYELDDLIQDGMICFYKCRKRYSNHPDLNKTNPTNEDRRHFMKLFKTTFFHHIVDLSNKRTRTMDAPYASLLEDQAEQFEAGEAPSLVAEDDRMITLMVKQAPKEVKDVLELVVKETVEGAKYVYRQIVNECVVDGKVKKELRDSERRETTREHFARRLGKDAKAFDAVGLVEEYFSPA